MKGSQVLVLRGLAGVVDGEVEVGGGFVMFVFVPSFLFWLTFST